ncbi:MAG: hypothetical protein NTZ13_02750 [Candidatus Parcubacteria bacterium]|nr:hypothetical protein [Candidatus Parcubacteria bacterium]
MQETLYNKEQTEYPITMKREELDAVLNDPNHTHKDLISVFEKDFNQTFDKSVGTNEGYSLRQHTSMMMSQYEKYFKGKELPGGTDSKFFETFLVLHDIGKPEAIEKTGDKDRQHEYTEKIMKSVLPQLRYTEKEISMATALIEGDAIGSFLQKGDAIKSAEEIVRIAGEHGLDKKVFFNLLTILFEADASSYTTDAGGSETSATNQRFVFNPEEKTLALAPDTKRLYDVLAEKVDQISYEDILNKKTPENPKEESYDFSKEFSKRGRNELAVEMYQLRRKYMKDLPEENEKRARERAVLSEKRGDYEQKIETAGRNVEEIKKEQSEWLAAQEELKTLKEEIEKRKSSIWYKIQRRFGGGQDVSKKESEYYQKKTEVGYFNEDRVTRAEQEQKYAESGRDMITYYDKQIEDVKDVIIDEAWHNKAKTKIAEFYGKQADIKEEFEQDKKDRDIQENVKKHNVLFLHGLPFEVQMANTSKNNQLVDTEAMPEEDKVLFLAGLEPTISVSSKILDSELSKNTPQRGETMYETGIIIGEGEIMSAHEEDIGTQAESLKIKHPKSGPSSIQTNISENIAKSINIGDRNDQRMTTWNEFIVRNPKITALYIMENAKNYDTALPRIQKLAKEMSIPVIKVSRDGKMFNLTEERETTKEEVMSNPKNFSTEEKIGFIERTEKFIKRESHPEMAEEIQKRLDALKEEKTIEEQKKEDIQKETEVRGKLEKLTI